MKEEEEEDESLILRTSDFQLNDSISSRTGTVWTALAHIITGVIGAGVLSLAWATAELGWIAGPISVVVFAGITLLSFFLLSDCYRYPDPDGPIRVNSYSRAVKLYLGKKNHIVSGVFLYIGFIGCDIAYTIVTANCFRAILRSNCYHREGHDATCSYGDNNNYIMFLFGVIQIFMSQIPNFHNLLWLSIVAAVMSFVYSFIGLGLSLNQIKENGQIKGNIKGNSTVNGVEKMWLVFQALGNVAFAYPFTYFLLEIQDTLKSPPAEKQTMKKASISAVLTTTFFYLCCGCFGYAAFGDATPGNLLTGFEFFEPYWLIDLANVCVVVHLVGGFQINCQPIFKAVETWLTAKYPENESIASFYGLKRSWSLGKIELNPMRICLRTMYVVMITGVAMLFPYFNEVLGVLGAFGFWPLTVYFPVEMCITQKKIRSWSRSWLLLRAFSFVCLLLSLMSFAGSLYGLVVAKSR